jgi:hypothetical protein
MIIVMFNFLTKILFFSKTRHSSRQTNSSRTSYRIGSLILTVTNRPVRTYFIILPNSSWKNSQTMFSKNLLWWVKFKASSQQFIRNKKKKTFLGLNLINFWKVTIWLTQIFVQLLRHAMKNERLKNNLAH